MSDDEQLTVSDLVSVGQLTHVIEQAVGQAPVGMAVFDANGNLIAERHALAAACPRLTGDPASRHCPWRPVELAWRSAAASPFQGEDRGGADPAATCSVTRPPEVGRPSPDNQRGRSTARDAVEDRCPEGRRRRAYPLAHRDRVWGALVACSHDGGTEPLVDAVAWLTAQRLCDLIAAGYDLHSLSQEIAANYEQLTLLYSSSAEMGAALDVDAICERVLEQIQAQVPSEAVAVLLLDEETGHARVAAARGELSDAFHVPMPSMPHGIFSHVLETGEPALVCDVPRPLPRPVPTCRAGLPSPAAGLTPADLPGGDDTSAVLCVPLIAHERVLGAVCARDKLSGEEYLANDAKLVSAIAAQAAIGLSNAQLFGDVKSLFLGTVRSLASAVDAKDPYTLGHSQRVTLYALAIAQELGLSAAECEDLQLAALLHDVGKIGLPDEILLKAGRLTPEEWEQVRRHPIWGEEILRPIKQLRRIAAWIRHEHERWNGSGYPDGLKGENIPLPSRIIAVADAFDALTSDRSYRKAVAVPQAIAILESAAGTEYDPAVVAAFLTACESGKISK